MPISNVNVEPSVEEDKVARAIVDAALQVHKALGPGLLESGYEVCLADELERRGFKVERQKPIDVIFKGRKLDAGYRADLIVDDKVLVELKSIERLSPLQEAQTLTYLKLSGLRLGLLINFNVPLIKNGIRRFVVNSQIKHD